MALPWYPRNGHNENAGPGRLNGPVNPFRPAFTPKA